MLKLLFILHTFGPAFFCYSIAYFIVHPDDWTGPAIVAPLGLLLTGITQRWGLKKIRQTEDGHRRFIFIAAQVGGLVAGLAIGITIYFLESQ